MQAIDIQTAPIDQLRAEFWAIMSDNIEQYGDNLERGIDGRAEATMPVSGDKQEMHLASRVGNDHQDRES